ncbi:hypothetical protein [Lacticaseibacillus parakribbianus]|uniref:hypothetical protein n=1 Tax=Lacticaseibacillus parakribbianus TaxID=2970927 RepID=UPI0021CB6B96|nr:hypothetical protein [Lacticaseibacillus parakribbianus]
MRHDSTWRRYVVHRYLAAAYALVYVAGTLLFFKLHFYRLAATNDPAYRARHANYTTWGLNRLQGNLTALHAPWMWLLLLAGVGVGIWIFHNSKGMPVRAYAGLVIAVAAAVPLLPPYSENLMARFYMAWGMMAVGVFWQQLVAKDVARPHRTMG